MTVCIKHNCCVSIQGLHPSEDTFEGQLRYNTAQMLTQSKGYSKCSPQMQPSLPSFWRMHRYYPWPHISQDSLRPKRRKKEGKWRYLLSKIVTFTGVGGRKRDVRGKHLGTQPGNAPKTRPSHLTTAEAVNKVSLKHLPAETAKAESFEGCRP